MTRKEMIAACVDDQIKRGIIREETRALQIRARLKGYAGVKAMSATQCREWYRATFNK